MEGVGEGGEGERRGEKGRKGREGEEGVLEDLVDVWAAALAITIIQCPLALSLDVFQ